MKNDVIRKCFAYCYSLLFLVGFCKNMLSCVYVYNDVH